MPRKPKESKPFLITPAHSLCASFVKDPRYNDLFKEVMRARGSWYDPNPVTTALKIFEYLEVLGKNAEYTLLKSLPEPDFDPNKPTEAPKDLDGF